MPVAIFATLLGSLCRVGEVYQFSWFNNVYFSCQKWPGWSGTTDQSRQAAATITCESGQSF